MLTKEEIEIVEKIRNNTIINNRDNITRTNAYADFYERNPEIKWSFLASMVSRNAGWNMCDLEGEWYPRILANQFRMRLFLTYERANWLIFSDAYPQLCIYEESKRIGKGLFHLLQEFSVSSFMEKQWKEFWEINGEEKLMISLIINEQNLIQRPVIEHPVYEHKVFKTWIFLLQDWLHFSTVLFPTRDGHLYGCSVHDFKKLTSRIKLGKSLAKILFHPDLYSRIHEFSISVDHTGSRHDYEVFLGEHKKQDTPILRDVFPVIHHHRHDFKGWIEQNNKIGEWLQPVKITNEIHITDWYREKQEQLHLGILMEQEFQELLSLNKLDPSQSK
ncbi:DUF2515 domain-containing protein [Bacillus suaedaesalsae]|uniref:DUF2515 domain-containing protein n=1 Tax=Bacillus suaedaesalsae TaxID=2810349 RepID=A0ABS2DMU5_9BACI|nr:DUF2515 domain-containing protein [Bacillus suaedaesalsae]MBM6619819.1 DUF2515 domain-containing protein [Bacillus suaedaesalsae]